MNWVRLRQRVLSTLSSTPQAEALCANALGEIEAAVGVLCKHGWQCHLALGPEREALAEWPKLLFHAKAAPNGRLCYGPEWLAEWGEGWADSAQEAQRIEGYAAQMAGRGGVVRRGLPMIVINK